MDIELHYVEKGEGEPLILLHGNGENLHYFVHQIDDFAAHMRVFAVDTRGHGHSPRGKAAFTIRQFAEDLREFMDMQGIAKASLLGFSDGGNIAIVFALKYPERVNHLILNGANLYCSGVKASVQIPITLDYYIQRFLSGKLPKAKRKEELLGLMVKDPNIRPEELRQIKARTLVIAGTEDLIKASHTKEIAAAIPGAKLAFVKGGHGIAHDNPQIFNRIVKNFLGLQQQKNQ